jgi:tyrosine-protein kinase Etk/Wzc
MTSFQNADFDENPFQVKEQINVREVFSKYIYHWPVFIIGLLLAWAAAFVYLRYTAPVYNVKSSILIKDIKSENGNLLKEMNLFPDSRAIDNEMEILRSKTLMRDVVTRLNLNVRYQTKGLAFKNDIYASRPFNFIPLDEKKQLTGSYQLTIADAESFLLENDLTHQQYRGKFNQVFHSHSGDYRIEKTPYFDGYRKQIIYLDFSTTESTATDVIRRLVLTPGKSQASVIDITLTEEVPQRGKDILDTLLEAYSIATIEEKNLSTKNSIKFLKDRLVYISSELNEVERTVESFKRNHEAVDLIGQGKDFEGDIKDNDAKVNEINLELEGIDGISNYLNNPRSDTPPFLLGVNQPSLVSQVNQLTELQLRYEKLLEVTPAANPLALTLEKQVTKARSIIKGSLGNIRNSLVRERQQLQQENAKFENTINSLPTVEREYAGMKRQQGIKESLYLLLLNKLETAALSSAVTLADSRILQQPYWNAAPIKPVKSSAYMFAIIAGLMLPFGYVYSKDALNYRVISNKDITSRTNVPILGDVMQAEGDAAIVVTDNSRSVVAEQFRSLRTNMQYIYGSNTASRVTLFTSSMSGEGKSFIASNLGAALAMTKRKTVILELDLRKPKVSRYLKLKNQVGLSNYLIGQATMEEIIQPSGVHPNFFVISSGPIPPNPAELLEQTAIDELVKWLKTQFQEVIIDTPPIGLVTDALILSRLADATIYVVRHGLTMKSQIAAIQILAKEKKFPKLNIVHNGVQLSGRFGYGYASQYGYGYGYAGSYGSYYTGKKKRSLVSRLPVAVRNFFKRF